MGQDADIVVVGAGAAGLAAGIFAAQTRPDLRVVLLDGARQIGAKILVSGGGRCNVTHAHVTPTDFNAPGRMVRRVLQRFDERVTLQWFASLGVPLKQEPTGKLFPVSNRAQSVLGALVDRCRTLGVRILTQHRVQDIRPTQAEFQIVCEGDPITARRVIMATGGRSLPKTGSDGQGWSIVQKLGHTVTATYPALVPLVLREGFFHSEVSGISHEATLTTQVAGKTVDRRTGSLLWTHFGISGPVVMDASRFWVMAQGQGLQATLAMSFLPGQTFEEVDRWLSAADPHHRRKTVLAVMAQKLPRRLAKALCMHVQTLSGTGCGKSDDRGSPGELGQMVLSRLARSQRGALTHALIDLQLPVTQARGWNEAEVTAGGVPLGEINLHGMASRKIPGLYLVGEMLDCDGRIGGFNFQWAWATGFIAGYDAARCTVGWPSNSKNASDTPGIDRLSAQ